MSYKPEFLQNDLYIFLEEKNIKVKTNIITGETTIDGNLLGREINPASKRELFYLDIYSTVKQEGKFYATLGSVNKFFDGYCEDINNLFNPVIDMLDKVELDKSKDYLGELFFIMGINENDELSKILIHKWLLQCIALSRNTLSDPIGADGMLVLQGDQGIGKTSLINKLGVDPTLVKLGCSISEFDKDTKISAYTCWICELGEFEKTIKNTSDAEMKNLVTNAKDEYRLPYDKRSKIHPRYASLVGTCNQMKFLTDDTGSRRYWVVPIDKIDLNRLRSFDVLHLWKQIENEFENNDRNCFRLSENELTALSIRNVQHERIEAAQEIEDIIAEAEATNHKFGWVTSTAFKTANRAISKYSAVTIGKALRKLNIEQKRTGKGQFYYLPLP